MPEDPKIVFEPVMTASPAERSLSARRDIPAGFFHLQGDHPAEVFRERLYVSPGTNDSRGIDCSGLFVKAYRDQGASIYHGSNTIYRKYCSEKGKLSSVSQLKPGMAVTIVGKGSEKKNQEIDIDTPRIVCLTPFSISDEDPPKAAVGEAESILTHIRNALAHGNTYLFANGNMML